MNESIGYSLSDDWNRKLVLHCQQNRGDVLLARQKCANITHCVLESYGISSAESLLLLYRQAIDASILHNPQCFPPKS